MSDIEEETKGRKDEKMEHSAVDESSSEQQIRELSRRSWSPAESGPPGLSTAIFVAVDGPPGPIMAATDGPPLPQVVPPVYFNLIQLVE